MKFDWKDVLAAILALIGAVFITLATNDSDKAVGILLTIAALILEALRVLDFFRRGGGGGGGNGSSGGSSATGGDNINISRNGHHKL